MSNRNEATIQALARLEAARDGILWRNNVGQLPGPNGRPVRYGLANDSTAVNQNVKSADLIGIRRVLITPEHVGQVLGVFWSREVKAEGWRFAGTERELAQLRWLELVTAHGGIADFYTGPSATP